LKEEAFWQDIVNQFAGYAGERESSCFLRAIAVTVTNVPLKEENMPREITGRDGRRRPIMAFSSVRNRS